MNNRNAIWLLVPILLLIYLLVFIRVGYAGLIVVYLVIAAVGSAALLVTRYAVKKEAVVTLRGVGVPYALRVAGHALYATEDNLIGFPSGTFEVAPGDSPNVIVASEFKPKRSHRVVLDMILLPWVLAGRVIAAVTSNSRNPLVLLVGQTIRVSIFVYCLFFFIVPLGLALLVEVVLKNFVASVITIEATEADNEVRLTITFQGATALMVKDRLLRAFEAPKLPSRYHTPSMAQAAREMSQGAST